MCIVFGFGQQRLDFGRKKQLVINNSVIQRLDAKMVSRRYPMVILAIMEHKSEHAVQPGNRLLPILNKQLE